MNHRSSTLIGCRSRRHLVQQWCARLLFLRANPLSKNALYLQIFAKFIHFKQFSTNYCTFHQKLKHFVQSCKNLLQRLSNGRPIRSVLLFFVVASTHTPSLYSPVSPTLTSTQVKILNFVSLLLRLYASVYKISHAMENSLIIFQLDLSRMKSDYFHDVYSFPHRKEKLGDTFANMQINNHFNFHERVRH